MERLKLHKKNSNKAKHAHPKIIPELAELGVYAQSVKPKKDWLAQRKCDLVYYEFLILLLSFLPSLRCLLIRFPYAVSNTQRPTSPVPQYLRIRHVKHHPPQDPRIHH